MATKKTRRSHPSAPKAVTVPEEMREWCALLAQELEGWPQVNAKRMFGMTSFYRGAQIFAAVPQTKAYFSPYSIIFKLPTPTAAQEHKLRGDAQVNLSQGIGAKWYGYELATAADIRGALEWLDEAFQAAKAPARNSSKPVRKRTA